MWDSLVAAFEPEMAVYIGTGIAAMVGAGYISIRAIVKGAKPSSTTVAAAIANASCGAPEVATLVREVRAAQSAMLATQAEIRSDLERVQDLVTRIEDRTRRR